MTRFTIPGLPPSGNVALRMHYHARNKINKGWYKDTILAAKFAGVDPHGDRRRRVTFTRVGGRNCDQDGATFSCKAPLDGLVRGGFLRDDSPKWVDLRPVEWRRKATDETKHLEITIEDEETEMGKNETTMEVTLADGTTTGPVDLGTMRRALDEVKAGNVPTAGDRAAMKAVKDLRNPGGGETLTDHGFAPKTIDEMTAQAADLRKSVADRVEKRQGELSGFERETIPELDVFVRLWMEAKEAEVLAKERREHTEDNIASTLDTLNLSDTGYMYVDGGLRLLVKIDRKEKVAIKRPKTT